MPFGPIIDAELTRLARQRRWYVLRVALGLGLLFQLYPGYEGTSRLVRGELWAYNNQAIRALAAVTLRSALIGQSVAVFFLAPLLVAGAIAEEKQRKTLHYLLASRLSGFEIVAGKLIARLLLVAMPVAMVVPVVVLAAILGRIEVWLIFTVYAATLTTVLFEAMLAILVSTLARRGREALLITFLLGLGWFAAPTLVHDILTGLREPWPSIYFRWIEPLNAPLIELSPLGLLRPGWTLPVLEARIKSMMIHQAVASAVLMTLATWALRPAFRRQDGSPKRRPARSRLGRFLTRRWRPRPPVGDDPMLWKETHGTPGSRLVGLVALLAAMTVVLLGYESLRDSVPQAWRALREHGYRVNADDPRYALNLELRVVAAGLFSVWTLLLMIAASTSISREREDDTWISLICTPVSGREILRAKLLGAAWSCRHLGLAIAGLIVFGAAMGAIHPLGAAIAAVQMAAFGLFVVAVGVLISLRARTTSAALGSGLLLLLALDLLLPLLLNNFARNSPLPLATSQPALLSMGMLSYPNLVDVRLAFASPPGDPDQGRLRAVAMVYALGNFAYLALGPLLLVWADRRFDRALDRPRRPVTAIARERPRSAARAGVARASLPGGRAG